VLVVPRQSDQFHLVRPSAVSYASILRHVSRWNSRNHFTHTQYTVGEFLREVFGPSPRPRCRKSLRLETTLGIFIEGSSAFGEVLQVWLVNYIQAPPIVCTCNMRSIEEHACG
jgi:hypothetical protein